MRKSIKSLVFVLLLTALIFSGCEQTSDPAPTPTPKVTEPSETDPATDAPTQAPDIKQEFLDYIKSVDQNADIDTIKSSIMDSIVVYGDSSIVEPSLDKDADLYAPYLVSVSDGTIMLDDIEITETDPFEYENKTEEPAPYDAAEDAIVYTFLITEDTFYYGFPVEDLSDYLETAQNNIFNVYIEDGTIKSMCEIYVP